MISLPERDEVEQLGTTSSSSDDEIPYWPPRIMTKEEAELHQQMVEESEGFNVPDFPGVNYDGHIAPLGASEVRKSLERFRLYANSAVSAYNKEQNTDLELVELVTVNAKLASPVDYYITFKAKDASGQTKICQAVVLACFPFPNHEIEMVRLKPTEPSGAVDPKDI